jgi:MYXO-CTERM domain-containing protein
MRRNLSTFLTAATLLGTAAIQSSRAADVLTFTSPWQFLLYTDAGNNQIDPASVDPDFYDTWYLPSTNPTYNGPAFSAPTPGPFAYAAIDYFNNNGLVPSSLGNVPNSGTRGTAYFKTEFDVGANTLTNVQLEYLADDGFILFLDGNVVTPYATYNMDFISTQWNQLAHGATDVFGLGTEAQLSYQGSTFGFPLADIGPGHHTLALSLHEAAVDSSDLGLAFHLSGDLVPVPEPTSAATGLLALGALAFRRRR